MPDNNHYPRKGNQHDGVFSKRVPAGKRTYFFDVKATRGKDYYVTITESKRQMGDDGTPFYEKHKVFIYGEDIQKFMDALNETIHKVNDLRESSTPSEDHQPRPVKTAEAEGTSFTDVSFEDLK